MKACLLSRILGINLAIHSVLMLTLATGVETNLAIGIAMTAWFLMPLVIPKLGVQHNAGTLEA